MNPKIQAFKNQVSPKVPEMYYNCLTQQFLVRQSGGSAVKQRWISVSEPAARDFLTVAGVRGVREKGEELSPADKMLFDIKNNGERTISYDGPVAGYLQGHHCMGSFDALVTESPKIPKAIKGDWSDIRAILVGLFGDTEQLSFFVSWCKLSRDMLVSGIRRGMPALILCGPRNCGKTFLQEHILTPLLGGRSVQSDRYFAGATQFNGEWAGAEHLMISDEAANTSTSARVEKGNRIKMIVANDTQSIHTKGKTAVNMTPFWRMTISVNDELENIMSLPLLHDSMEDKIMLFRVTKFKWPIFAYTVHEKEEFKHRIHSQINAFCWYLDNEFSIPKEMTMDKNGSPARYGVMCYHHPEIVRRMDEVSPERKVLEMLRQCFFTVPNDTLGKKRNDDLNMIVMSVRDMETGLMSDDSPVKYEARRMLSSGMRLPTYLNRLTRKYPGHVFQRRSSKERVWCIMDINDILNRTVEDDIFEQPEEISDANETLG